MFVTSLISLGLAIASLYISANIADEIERLVVKLIALFLLFLSLAFAPLPIKLLIAIALLITAKQTHTLNQDN
ncbi:hypothetical protein [Mastigocladopsis repens]|uniref:hypothetical protein n=1 Tax=Mastigocladopsis repens TaxID=221287 RepID=UPI0002E44BF9|nr:hypothetical protein [Mastigocladopsis repens]